MSYPLKLSHRRHSGRHLPHSQTSFGGLVIVLVLASLVLFGLTIQAQALTLTGQGSYSVNAAVIGAAPPSPPTITSPVNGQHVSVIPVDVRGTCHAGLLVNIYKNEVLAGAAICSAAGTFTVPIDLFIGRNDLIAREYTASNLVGPDSATVTVYYDVASFPVNVSTGGTSGKNGSLIIKSESVYKGIRPGDTLKWPIEIVGGVGPYAVNIDWGWP